MRAKDYLKQILSLERQIKNKFYELERWKELATSSTAAAEEGERVQASGMKDKMAEAVCKYVDMEAELTADIERLAKARQDIIKTIERLCTDEYDVLHKRYVQNLDLQQIADQAGKSKSWAASIHGKALLNVQRILESEKSNGTNRGI